MAHRKRQQEQQRQLELQQKELEGLNEKDESLTGPKIIRKRKRKSSKQIHELTVAFDVDPHWSKEKLHWISKRTNLTEAQVYKWGWDQKRKKFGEAEAVRMRRFENILDQQNAKKNSSILSALKLSNSQAEADIPKLIQRQLPELTPENKSVASEDSYDVNNYTLASRRVSKLQQKEASKIDKNVHLGAF